MLELKDVCYTIDSKGNDIDLLKSISFSVTEGHFMAIVGPSGCGKTTLLKLIAGINEESEGAVLWSGRNLSTEEDLDPNEVGYVPQFSIAYDHLSVRESVLSAIRLRVYTKSEKEVINICNKVLEETGMMDFKDNSVKVLSGGQKRRLGLALELVCNPRLLLCDEVTSGLDPKSESEIVDLLHDLANNYNRIVISVTHSLSNLSKYDSVLVLHQGNLAYHGSPSTICHYFQTESAEEIYPQLAMRTSEDWHYSWRKHNEYYYSKVEIERSEKLESKNFDNEKFEVMDSPSFFNQFLELLSRRFLIFFRDKTYLFLHIAMLIGFPILVSIFALKGVPELPFSPNPSDFASAFDYGEKKAIFASDQAEIGGLISGLIMFQVILLTLMGSNNAAREIASERNIFEKEKLAGISINAYLLSKIVFLFFLVLLQSLWMGIFVKTITGIPGSIGEQFILLFLVNFSMTMICLGISSLMKSEEQASLLCVYLVGFQLPLSGAVLAIPDFLDDFIQPFVTAYWSWSGQLDSLKTEGGNFYDAVKSITDTDIKGFFICLCILIIHSIIGIFMTQVGIRGHRWN